MILMKPQETTFRRSVTIAELLISLLLFIGACVGTYTVIITRISLVEKRMDMFEDSNKEFREYIRTQVDNISNKIDDIKQGQNDLRLKIENKQDRK